MYKVRQAVRKHRKLLSVCAMVLAIALMFWAVNSPAIVGVSAAKRVLPIYMWSTPPMCPPYRTIPLCWGCS